MSECGLISSVRVLFMVFFHERKYFLFFRFLGVRFYMQKRERKEMAKVFILDGLVGFGLWAAIGPINFALVATGLRELIVRGGVVHVLVDTVEILGKVETAPQTRRS